MSKKHFLFNTIIGSEPGISFSKLPPFRVAQILENPPFSLNPFANSTHTRSAPPGVSESTICRTRGCCLIIVVDMGAIVSDKACNSFFDADNFLAE